MKKMLLMGSAGAGKTSMHRVIFAHFPAKDTAKIGYTMSKQEHKITIMENIELKLWDCGFQNEFVRQYFSSRKEYIFSGTSVLLYVFDVDEGEDKIKESLDNFRQTLTNLKHYSPNAEVFVLVHKIDLIHFHQRKNVFEKKREVISKIAQIEKTKVQDYFATTIWDQSLYQAWSAVIQSLIPNKQFLRDTLQKLCQACNCFDVILFEKSTFLVMMHYSLKDEEGDVIVYQRLATLLKTLKISCRRIGGKIKEIDFGTSAFSGMVLDFTPTQNIMVVSQYPLSQNRYFSQIYQIWADISNTIKKKLIDNNLLIVIKDSIDCHEVKQVAAEQIQRFHKSQHRVHEVVHTLLLRMTRNRKEREKIDIVETKNSIRRLTKKLHNCSSIEIDEWIQNIQLKIRQLWRSFPQRGTAINIAKQSKMQKYIDTLRQSLHMFIGVTSQLNLNYNNEMIANIIQEFYYYQYKDEVLREMQEVGYKLNKFQILEYQEKSSSIFSCCCFQGI